MNSIYNSDVQITFLVVSIVEQDIYSIAFNLETMFTRTNFDLFGFI